MRSSRRGQAAPLSFNVMPSRETQVQDVDDEFYERADAHIHLSNDQISKNVGKGKVSASFMYSVARFNAYVSACGFDSSQGMSEEKEEIISYFVSEYRKMLDENVDDYIQNFESYMRITDGQA